MSIAVAVRGEVLWLCPLTDTTLAPTDIPEDQATDAQELVLPVSSKTSTFLGNQGPTSALPLAIRTAGQHRAEMDGSFPWGELGR